VFWEKSEVMAVAQTQSSSYEASGSDIEVVHHFIGGQKVEGTSGRFGNVYNPALGTIARKVDFANKTEVDNAVKAAAAAFPVWSAV
jgi:malonate-semialdehyde dehydrogenase (acetylating) / methylmalonate-semialdehyde dehydrogenase